jgi:hypothetical protein
MNAAQQAKDTAVITNLMKGYSDIQAVGSYKDKIYDICGITS